jgi:methyl acetate hydrolase
MKSALNRRSILGAGAALLVNASSAAAASDSPPRSKASRHAKAAAFDQVDMALARAVETKKVAGVVAMAATEDGLVYQGSFGKRGAADSADMSPDTIFWLLSMTKAVTATACMQLVEQGKLRLDQPMSEVLPELANPLVLEGYDSAGQPKLRSAKRPITLRHLLTHTSGFTYSGWSDALLRYEKVTGMPDIATCKNGAFAAPLEFDPGDRWQYGISMDWVGKVVEAVADQSLEIYFRENIFAPLGMTDTGFLIGSQQKRRVATLFNRQEDGTLKSAPFEMPQRPEFFMGGGGLFGTPADYMMFLQMLLNDGTFRGAKVLRPETVKLMQRNQIGELRVTEMKTSAPAYSRDFDQFPNMTHKWGLSFDINPEPGPNGRSGGSISWGGLLNCYFWLDPTKRVTGAIFTQVLPFFDPDVLDLYAAFERGIYGLKGA